MTIELELNVSPSVPLELEGVTPDRLRLLPRADIERLPIFEGNRKISLADFFRISGCAEDGELVISGDLSGVHWIGAKMSAGRISIHGNVGRHVGSEMSGGSIHVEGNASDWVGAEMVGGTIRVQGDAGHLVGAAYRGSPRGMRGGTILVTGNVGNELGHSMRRGLIAVGGSAGDLVGFNMLAGTILVAGATGIRHGAGMRRGTLIFLAPDKPELLPTFTLAGRQQPPMMPLLCRELRDLGFPETKADLLLGTFELFHGDQIEGGRGEFLVRSD